jgi:hypothetical protein
MIRCSCKDNLRAHSLSPFPLLASAVPTKDKSNHDSSYSAKAFTFGRFSAMLIQHASNVPVLGELVQVVSIIRAVSEFACKQA